MRYWTPERLAARRHGMTPPRPALAQVMARIAEAFTQMLAGLAAAIAQVARDVMAALSAWGLACAPPPGPPWRFDATLVRRAVVARGGW